MGQDVKLRLQIPIKLITSKRWEDKKSAKQSELQYLRLWQAGRHQYLLFFANASTNKYKDFRSKPKVAVFEKRNKNRLISLVELFRPVETKSKTTVRLDVHLPGMIRRNSKSQSPVLVAKHSPDERNPEHCLTGSASVNDLKTLDHVSIEFDHAAGELHTNQGGKPEG